MGREDHSLTRRWAVAGPLLLLLLGAVAVTTLRPETGYTLGGLGMAVGDLAAAVLVWRRSRRLDLEERRAWRFLAAGLAAVATGVVVVGVLTELGVPLPAIGPTDVFFLAGYGMLIVMFVRLARSDGEARDWLPTILDASVGAIALSVLVWTFFFRDLLETLGEAGPWEAAVGLSYPVLDIAAVIGLMILVNRRSHFRRDPRLLLLALGMGTQVSADFLFLSAGIDRPFAEIQPNFPLLLVATMCFLASAALVDRSPARRELPEQESRLLSFMWPYLLAGVLLAAHVAEYRRLDPGGDRTLLLDALLAVGGVVFLRQLYMIHRNRTQVDRQRSELVASVSHELRTPLTAMVGYLSLLEEGGDEFPEDARRDMLAEATDQAKHIARLVSDLVLVARGDNQRQVPLEITAGDLTSVVTDALRGIDTANTRIQVDLPAGNLPLRVDTDRIRQAVANLVSNAIRYGGDEVLVVGKALESDLVLEVHDSGPGVPIRYEHTIWRRFERGAHRLNAANPGMGVGLAIVRAIAQAHGGRAGYRRSELLGGACFYLSVPGCVEALQPERLKT